MSSPAAEQTLPTKSTSDAKFAVAVIGNPNTGKTTLFNALTGLNQHVGNYPGVTVERKEGTLQLDADTRIDLIDLPGTYSLAARSPDEMIAVDVLLGQQQGAKKIDAILAIADASNPERNFYLISQLCELNLPVVIALNMCDVAQSKGIEINIEKLSQSIGTPVVGICANKGKNLPELRAALKKALVEKQPPRGTLPRFPEAMDQEVEALKKDLADKTGTLKRDINRLEAFRILVDKNGFAEQRLEKVLGDSFKQDLESRRKKASSNPLPAEEVRVRYGWVKQVLAESVKRPAQPPPTSSDAIDKVLTHWFTGTLAFALLMMLVFQTIFHWAEPLMGGIESIFNFLGDYVGERMAEGALKSLVCKGVIAGVGGVLVFLPQICLLFMFIAIMEDCGYMARAAFLMDRLLSRVGLSGKSFIPMLSSFACAVPGVMATRTIENPRDRLTTILISPLMSCSARIPVYMIMIGAFIPEVRWGIISLHGLTLFGMYAVGILVAVPVAFLLKKTVLKGETPPFLIELPSYKVPDWRTVLLRVYDRGKAFTIRAGTIILAVSIVVWALAYFPRPDAIAEKFSKQRDAAQIQHDRQLSEQIAPMPLQSLRDPKSQTSLMIKQIEEFEKKRNEDIEKAGKDTPEAKAAEETYDRQLADMEKVSPMAFKTAMGVRKLQQTHKDELESLQKTEAGEYLRQSYFGKMGSAVEPLFKPLGWDWRIAMAAIASFPAREVIVATLGEIFNLGADVNEEDEGLRDALRQATWDHSNTRLFNIPVALSIMVFFALCSQCAATLATIKRETNSWRWPVFSFVYMTALAYVGALITYQLGMALGWGNV